MWGPVCVYRSPPIEAGSIHLLGQVSWDGVVICGPPRAEMTGGAEASCTAVWPWRGGSCFRDVREKSLGCGSWSRGGSL